MTPPETVRIRPYEAGDRDACRSLWVELTQRHRDIYGVDTIGGDTPGDHFDSHLEKVGHDDLWVAVDGAEVIGLAGIQVTDDITEVEPAIVTGARRGEGIGRLLVEHVIGIARDRGITLLSVRPVARNAEAIRFYHDLGFTTLGYIEMFIDLADGRDWVAGETLAGREFRT